MCMREGHTRKQGTFGVDEHIYPLALMVAWMYMFVNLLHVKHVQYIV